MLKNKLKYFLTLASSSLVILPISLISAKCKKDDTPNNPNQKPNENQNPQLNQELGKKIEKEDDLTSFSYENLTHDVYKDKKWYDLQSYELEDKKVDRGLLQATASTFIAIYKLEKFLNIPNAKISKERITELYNEYFQRIHIDLEKISKYKRIAMKKFARFEKISDYNLKEYYKNKFDKMIEEASSNLDGMATKFINYIEQGKSKESEFIESAIISINLIYGNKKTKTTGIIDEQIIKIFARMLDLVPEEEYGYFQKNREKKLNSLKINQKQDEPKKEELRQALLKRKNKEITLNLAKKFSKDTYKFKDAPEWLNEYISQFEDPKKPYSKDQKEEILKASAIELELARQAYLLTGDGYDYDFSFTNWDYVEEKKQDSTEITLKNGLKFLTQDEKFEDLKWFIINKLNEIVDERWTDLQKVEAVVNYIMWKYEYASDEELNSYKNASGLSLADPYNITLKSKNKVVCDGYARTLSLFLYYLGIPNRYIGGRGYKDGISHSTDPKNDSELHAWNEVYLDINGKKGWYPIDLTWSDHETNYEDPNDPGNQMLFDHSLVLNSQDFRDKHVADPLFKYFYIDKVLPLK